NVVTATTTPQTRGSIPELVLYFLRLGFLGFGGPVALVGQMERELVAEKGWLTKEQMRESIAICQSLPGPLAIQVGIYIAWLRCGFWGAGAGGWAFILPNFVIVAALGALFVHLGDLKAVTGIFYGVSPAVIALILHSCWRLAKLGMEDYVQWAVAAVCLVVTIALQAEGALLFLRARLVRVPFVSRPVCPPPSSPGAGRRPRAGAGRAGRDGIEAHPARPVLPQGRLAHLRQRPRHRAVPRAGAGAAVRLPRRAPVPHRGRDRHDQPRPGRDHRDLRRLPRPGLLGLGRVHRRHPPAVLPARV